MTGCVDRTAWPWNYAPPECEDYDAAVWHAVRRTSELAGGYLLPQQDLETWVREQRASRSRERIGSEPLTDAEHTALLAAIAAVWHDADALPMQVRFGGRFRR